MKVTKEGSGYRNVTIVLETQDEEETLYWALREVERNANTFFGFKSGMAKQMREQIR